jgi:hypothetical protein
MNSRSILQNLAVMIIFPAIGVTMFTEGVRTVQILGLMASGAVFGVYLARLLMTLKARKGSS